MNPKPAFDNRVRGRIILALQQAIAADFTSTDWLELGFVIGQHNYIAHHDRLLRSLRFGDDDYGACIFQFLSHLADSAPDSLSQVAEHVKIRPQLEHSAPDVLHELGLDAQHVASVQPTPSASEVVKRALRDAETLLASSGAISAVDRLHTALHGYLRSLCSGAGLESSEGSSITQLLKTLRTKHPALKNLGAQDSELARVLMAFGTIVDSLNTIRNHASVAHPNKTLLDEAEASLTVNSVRTIFSYLVRKMG